jgi:hypothetical protein
MKTETHNNTLLPDRAIRDFASKSLPVLWTIPDALRDTTDSNHSVVSQALEAIADEAVDEFKASENFFFCERFFPEDVDKSARLGLLIVLIDTEILRRRNGFLRSPRQQGRIAPYDHAALADVVVDENLLVDMSGFDTTGRTLVRNSWVFDVIPTLPSLNSSYWLMSELFNPNLNTSKKLRLDPFLIQPLAGYSKMEFKMRVYGQPLDWKSIGRAREPVHLQWIADPSEINHGDKSQTDLVWSPRKDGIHFVCEELPAPDSCAKRGSRYFHAIYDPSSEVFVHADGALRFYTPDDLLSRNRDHVRKAGKMGNRVKVFQLDGSIDRDAWCSIVSAFFVWNDDVMEYFGASVA